MPFFILVVAARLYQLFDVIIKIVLVLYGLWLLGKLVRRWTILCFYNKIDRVVVTGKKDLVKRSAVPTGYSEGYYRVEHYKYVFTNEGAEYKTRVYFGNRFFVPYSFKDSDKLFHRLINDAGITIDDIKI